MSFFRRESLPQPRNFYEREIGRLTKPNYKAWSLGNCPFHKSKSRRSFGVNLDSGAFCCFGCGRKGDLVSFVMQRDGVDFKTAAQSLGAWSDGTLTREGRMQIAEAERQRQAKEQATANDRQRRLRLRDEILVVAAIYREANDRLAELGQGAAPAYEGEAEHCWAVLALAHEDLRLTELEHSRAAGLETDHV